MSFEERSKHVSSCMIPHTKKLFTCGVFGVSSDEFLNYALINRKEWEQKGEEMVREYLRNYEEEIGKNDSSCVDFLDPE